jgi:hypothetical protein
METLLNVWRPHALSIRSWYLLIILEEQWPDNNNHTEAPIIMSRLTSNSDESNLVICCWRSALRPGTRTTSVCILTIGLPVRLLSPPRFRFRGVMGSGLESSSSSLRSSRPAEANKCKLLASLLAAAALLPTPPLLPLASSPSDDHSSLVEMVDSQQTWKNDEACRHILL